LTVNRFGRKFDTFQEAREWGIANPGGTIAKSPDGRWHIVKDATKSKVSIREMMVLDYFHPVNPDEFCLSGIDMQSRRSIRIYPYIKTSEILCDDGIHHKTEFKPGTIISGTFSSYENLPGPHQEDMKCTNWSIARSASGLSIRREIAKALASQVYDSIDQGFNGRFNGQRKISTDHPLSHSMITIRVIPESVELVKPDKDNFRLHFQDFSNMMHRNYPFKDPCFSRGNYSDIHGSFSDIQGTLNCFNEIWEKSTEIYLRIGLTRPLENPGEEKAYYMYIMGLYDYDHSHPSHWRIEPSNYIR
jgi:hypothetical protein